MVRRSAPDGCGPCSVGEHQAPQHTPGEHRAGHYFGGYWKPGEESI